MANLVCIYCQLPFASASSCPHCGNSVASATFSPSPTQLAANENDDFESFLKFEDLDEDFEIVPDHHPAPAAPSHKPIARA